MRNTLVPLIKRYLKQGYDINSLRNNLERYGYDKELIEKSIEEVYKEKKLSRSTLITVIVVFVFLIIGASAFFIYMNLDTEIEPKNELLDFKLEPVTMAAKNGEQIVFITKIIGKGEGNVELKYELLSVDSGNVVLTKEGSQPIGTESSQVVINISNNVEVGNYILKSNARYFNKEAKSALPVKVYKETVEESCFDNIKNQDEEEVDCGGMCKACEEVEGCPITCDDKDRCTNDYCDETTNFECRHDKVRPCCGNNICEDDESYKTCSQDCNKPIDTGGIFEGLNSFQILEKIKEISKDDPDRAGRYCESLDDITLRDQCFFNLAEVTNSRIVCEKINDERRGDTCYSKVAKAKQDSSICEDIGRDNVRDSCFMNFVLDFKDYGVCDKIVNEYLQDSCESLKKISELQ